MSLTIKVEKVYLSDGKNVVKDGFLGGDSSIDCTCKVKFKNCVRTRTLARNPSIKFLLNNENIENAESEELLSKTNQFVIFQLGSPLDYNDILEIECYKDGKFVKKLFGVYKMLLDSVRSSENFITIDDFLINPKTNLTLEERIVFVIEYRKPIKDVRGRLKHSESSKSLMKKLDVDYELEKLEEFDFISRSHDFEKPSNKNDSDEIVENSSFLKSAVAKATLSLAQVAYNPNNIINDETIMDITDSVKEEPSNVIDNSTGLTHQDFKELLSKIMEKKMMTNKLSSWQIRVHLIEIKHLLGNNKEIFCTVNIGDKQFTTASKPIDKLVFDEVFTNRIDNIKSQKVFNLIISICVYCKQFIKSNLIGKFEIDFGTIYNHPDHEYFHKWGPIISTESYNSSGGGSFSIPKGFVKCSLSIHAKGDKVLMHKEDPDKDDDIDNNMILPRGLDSPRIFIELNVKIFSADILLKYRITKFEKMKMQLSNLKKNLSFADNLNDNSNNDVNLYSQTTVEMEDENNEHLLKNYNSSEISDNLNLFVRISFCGQVERTSSIMSTTKPVWNESFKFQVLFPSLIRLFKIELCSEEMFGVKILATEYLDIDSISDYNVSNFYPTFGPCNIDLYSEPDNLRIKSNTLNNSNIDFGNISNYTELRPINSRSENSTKIINRNYVPINGCTPGGGDYIARLLIEIKSYKYGKSKDRQEINNDIKFEKIKRNKKHFIVFILISEVTMIDSRYNGDLSFQLCIGTNGYEQLNKIDLSTDNVPTNFTKQQKAISLGSKMPFYLPYEKSKPCMSLKFKIEDLRYYMYAKNLIRNSLKIIVLTANKLLESKDKLDYNNYLSEILKIKKYLENIYLKVDCLSELERNRAEQLINELENIIGLVKSIQSKSSLSFRKHDFTKIRDYIDNINHYIAEPLSLFPDVNLWLLSDKEPVGICTIKSNDIIWSHNEFERGSICNQMIYTDIKSLNSKDFEKPLYENIARIRAHMWLGLEEEIETIFDDLPDGYGLHEKYINNIDLPKYIFFNERSSFELLSHIYQGRDLLGLDSSGLSDPFVKITLGNQSVTSLVKYQTNNPTWNTTLIIPEINIYSKYDNISINPPEIILEIFDEDKITKNELMGKCYIKPVVQTSLHNTPKLKWFKVFIGSEHAGDILASFELLLKTSNHEDSNTNKKFRSIPLSIMPKSRDYTLEILFWGIRNLKFNNSVVFFGRERIKIRIQIGEWTRESTPIDKCFSNDNFLVIHQKHDLKLPEEIEYKPHLNITCLYDTSMGKKSDEELIGSYTVKSINDYFMDAAELKEKYKTYITKHFGKLNRLTSSYYDRATEYLNFKSETQSESLEIMKISKESKALKSKEKNNEKEKDIEEVNLSDLDTEYLDWWSKYYGSIKDDDSIDSDSIDEGENKIQKKTENEIEEKISEIKLKKKKKRKIKRIKIKKFKKKKLLKNKAISKSLSIDSEKNIVKNLSKSNSNSSQEDQEVVKTKKLSTEKIEIFKCELEKVDKFADKFSMLDTFSLYRGKNQQHNDEAIQCQFKGKFLLYDQEDRVISDSFDHTVLKRYGGFLKLVPPNTPLQVKARIYIVKASIYNIRDGNSSPYISIQAGDKILDDTENMKSNTTEPLFGKMYEYNLKFPYQSQITISVKGWGLIGNKGLIGKTTIDLEDRFFSDCYANCGIPKKYETSGYNAWRDIMTPSQILNKLCKKWRMKLPEYGTNSIKIINLDEQTKEYMYDKASESDSSSNKDIFAKTNDFNDFNDSSLEYDPKHIKEELALKVLNDWFHITGVHLVPEHVETRSLYNPETPGIEQGSIEMWIDLFSMEETNNMPQGSFQIPRPIDISPRKPKKFQLRVIIYNTEDVLLDDVNPLTGEKSSDIYVKGFICEKVDEAQKTDTHLRSLNGEGNFNWRFIFDFDYLPAEELIVYKTKGNTFLSSPIERKMAPIITLQCWDADIITSDDNLGAIQLNLCKMIKGAKTSKECKISMIKSKKLQVVNLFKKKKHRGWWPFIIDNGNMRLTGKLEAEFQLLNEQQALERPAGLGRSEPDPLPEPNRPQDSFTWFTSPMRTFRFIIWKNYKCLIIQIFIFVLILIFILIFIYQLPSTIIQKMFSSMG